MIYLYGFMLSMTACFFLMPEGSRAKWAVRAAGPKKGRVYLWDRVKFREFLLVIAAALPLGLISALRYGLGTDYENYATEFLYILGGDDLQYESGYLRFARLVGKIVYHRHAIIAAGTIVFIALCFYLMYKYSRNICLSLFIFFFSYVYFISLNNMRQSVAEAVALFGICALTRRRKIIFLISVLIAATIHQACIAYLALLVFYLLDISAAGLFGISVTWMLFHKAVLNAVFAAVFALEEQMPRLHGISFYLKSNLYMSRTVGRTLILFDFCLLFLMALIERVWCAADRKDPAWKVIKYSQFMLTVIYALDGSFPAVYRIARLFSFPQFIFLPYVLKKVPDKHWRFLAYCFVIFGFLFFFYINYRTGAEQVFPYYSILER